MKLKSLFCLTALLAIAGIANADTVADFENLTLSPDSFWSGTYPVNGDWATGAETTSFTTQSVSFSNTSDGDGFTSWDGWAYSNMTDTTNGTSSNQYSANTGIGADGSDNYGVCYWSPYALAAPRIDLNTTGSVSGAYFTNTTYAAKTLLNGSGFSKEFGGETGNDEDWFKMTIIGKDAANQVTATVDFLLADYTFADNQNDYIVEQWTWVDLSALGNVAAIEFSFSSTDNDPMFGINTPTYVAMDNLTFVPEPATIALLGLGYLFINRRRKA